MNIEKISKYVTVQYQDQEYTLNLYSKDEKLNKPSINIVIYNKNFNRVFQVSYLELIKVMNNLNRVYAYNTVIKCKDIQNNEEYITIVKNIQHNSITDKIMHMEFYLLNHDSKSKIIVPVPISIIDLKLHKLSVELNKPIIQVLKNISISITDINSIPRNITISMARNLKKYRISHLIEDCPEIKIPTSIDNQYTIAKLK